MKKPILQIEKVRPDVKIPELATQGSACFDLQGFHSGAKEVNNGNFFDILPHGENMTLCGTSRYMIPTGLKVNIPEGYEIQIRPRSGFALKYGLRIENSPGTVDSDFYQEIRLIISVTDCFSFKDGERLAQMSFKSVYIPEIEEIPSGTCESLEKEAERKGGFGSTGS